MGKNHHLSLLYSFWRGNFKAKAVEKWYQDFLKLHLRRTWQERTSHARFSNEQDTWRAQGESLLDAQNNQSGTKGGDWAGKRERGAQNLLSGKKNKSKISQELKLTPWIPETFNFTPLDPVGLPLEPLGPCRPTPWPPGILSWNMCIVEQGFSKLNWLLNTSGHLLFCPKIRNGDKLWIIYCYWLFVHCLNG